MSTASRYLFEGQHMTVTEVHQRVPALSKCTIRKRLTAGCDSVQRLLAWDETAGHRRGGQASRAANEARGIFPLRRFVPRPRAERQQQVPTP